VHFGTQQNLLIYVKREALPRYPKLAEYQKNSFGPWRSFPNAVYPRSSLPSTYGLIEARDFGFGSFGERSRSGS